MNIYMRRNKKLEGRKVNTFPLRWNSGPHSRLSSRINATLRKLTSKIQQIVLVRNALFFQCVKRIRLCHYSRNVKLISLLTHNSDRLMQKLYPAIDTFDTNVCISTVRGCPSLCFASVAAKMSVSLSKQMTTMAHKIIISPFPEKVNLVVAQSLSLVLRR